MILIYTNCFGNGEVHVGKEREKERKILECIPIQLWLVQLIRQQLFLK